MLLVKTVIAALSLDSLNYRTAVSGKVESGRESIQKTDVRTDMDGWMDADQSPVLLPASQSETGCGAISLASSWKPVSCRPE
ncbi:hypothetical protein ILYODFUR_027025 [Ilyodon furcidens]|uniref:Uncharacterized protein n=1 Tax=Ilyodon furcidens TaxID=33524 RepID=A0ABV0SRT7_9TELE